MDRSIKRIESIQIIRAIAFILIFLSHVKLLYTGPVGVSLFLVLSGFCMTYSYLERPERIKSPGVLNNLKFAWAKVKRIYPLHMVGLISVALIVFGGLFLHNGSGREIAEQGVYFIANSLLLQSWIPWDDGYYSFNAVSWYLSTAFFSYFLFPWIFRTIQSKNKNRIERLTFFTLGLMIITAIILGIGNEKFGWTKAVIKWVVYVCPLYRTGDFIIGLVTGYVFVSRKKRLEGKTFHTIAQIVVIALMILQVLIYSSGKSATNWTLSLFWLPTSVLCVYLFAENKGIVSNTLSKSNVLIWLGDISGEAFLIHQICIKGVEFLIKNKWFVAVIAFALSIICTVIWRFLYEKIRMSRKVPVDQ